MALPYRRAYLCLCVICVCLDVSAGTFPGSQNNSSAKFFSTTTPTTSAIENLLKGYDRNLRPNFGGPAVDVLVSMQIASIDQISEVDLILGIYRGISLGNVRLERSRRIPGGWFGRGN
ncbi:Gamma-aminobutyric acid receptor subunit beta-1 [Branchiostoma belcheri]|nr:Gamma-aminobutyric acid receptor subunit beta-1 [Branchiostoma belcheri]